jgi:hypothetical protein
MLAARRTPTEQQWGMGLPHPGPSLGQTPTHVIPSLLYRLIHADITTALCAGSGHCLGNCRRMWMDHPQHQTGVPTRGALHQSEKYTQCTIWQMASQWHGC